MSKPNAAPDIADLVDDRPFDAVFRVDKRVFLDPGLFERELRAIFEGGWVFLCHESQIRSPGDYFTGFIGRQPVFALRQKDGSIGGFLNACPHRSSMLLPLRQGALKGSTITCRLHGWVFGATGKCIKVKFEDGGGYVGGEASGGKASGEQIDLMPLARIQSYRGFVFASLKRDVAALASHLGAAATFIDLLVDQSPDGVELLRGSSTYVCRHNWKIQVENVVDGYHTPTLHRVFANTMIHREMRDGVQGMLKTETGRILDKPVTGCYDLGNGHVAIWTDRASPEAAPLYPATARIERSFGTEKANWMLRRGRNILVFPNLIINDLASTHIRTVRPLGVDQCEITIWCIAPVGEPAEARYARLRKFEDFFLVTGFATSDDVASLDCVQTGSQATARQWTDYSRGMATVVQGADAAARELGFEPVTSNSSFDHETSNHGIYRHWTRVMGADSGADSGAHSGAHSRAQIR
ncbi:MAG: benzoate 1,2-dioxygenase large subunit [Betaproteobacteria bacterium]|nr:benzoate 1,2-dioxygenase large subunit [Betaproteobacteria bacterium]